MSSYLRTIAGLSGLALLFLLPGCAKNQAPQPLPLDQVPAAISKAFAKAPTAQKELADRVVSALQEKQIANAMMVVEGLCKVPDLTPEQRETASRALLTLNQELQAAAERGDKAAADFQRMRQSTR